MEGKAFLLGCCRLECQMAQGRHATGIQGAICIAHDKGRVIHWAHLRLLKWVRGYPERAGSWSSKMVGVLVTQVRAV